VIDDLHVAITLSGQPSCHRAVNILLCNPMPRVTEVQTNLLTHQGPVCDDVACAKSRCSQHYSVTEKHELHEPLVDWSLLSNLVPSGGAGPQLDDQAERGICWVWSLCMPGMHDTVQDGYDKHSSRAFRVCGTICFFRRTLFLTLHSSRLRQDDQRSAQPFFIG
jgi:hypothetical protein